MLLVSLLLCSTSFAQTVEWYESNSALISLMTLNNVQKRILHRRSILKDVLIPHIYCVQKKSQYLLQHKERYAYRKAIVATGRNFCCLHFQ